MIKNYFKTAWRNLVKSKGHSFINIGGLAIGMAVAILIGLWIYDELSFNKYHKNYDRIAQVMRHFTFEGKTETGGQSNPIPLSTELRHAYGSDFTYIVMSTKPVDFIISYGDKKFTQQGRFMQADAAKMLTLNMLHGTRNGLDEINSVLLSGSLARKLFGKADPINQTLKIDGKTDAKVTGVYEDLPGNSEFKDLTYIAPFDLYASFNKWVQDVQQNWNDNSFPIYVQISPEASFEKVSARIKNVMLPHLDEGRKARNPAVFLHPMRKWHLYSSFENGVNVTSEPLKFVWFYGIIGVFILLLACINFMNLSTARSEKRAREVGVRKAVGSERWQLISLFFSESLVTTAFAFLLSLGLAYFILPWFNGVADKKMVVLWINPFFWLAGLVFILITGLLAGTYPALYLSSFKPVKVLKGTFRAGRFASVPRKFLVVLQFTVSISLIIGTVIVYRQIQFAKDRPVGYSRNSLLAFQMTSPETREKFEVLREELRNSGVVAEVAASASHVTNIWSQNSGFDWKGKDAGLQESFGTLSVTHEYGKTIGWQLIAGRDFSRDYSGDTSGFVINEAAAKLMKMEKPVGETIKWGRYKDRNFTILGVVKDMVMDSPFEPAYPTIFFMDSRKNWLFMKVNAASSMNEALPKIESAFKKIVPSVPFDYKFVDEEYASKFSSEVRIGRLAGFFAILAVLISCLGLFGLVSFVAEQRTREIGIRKVIGASAVTIWKMLTKDFVALVVISCFIAIPAAYYFLHEWLQKYQYRTELSWWIFLAAAAGALFIALLTVSIQAIRAAITNPVRSLRTE
jgi:putative ABC transport system permease protein